MKRIEKSVGERLRKVREILGLSQNQMAKELGVSQSAIAKWEASERDIPTTVLIKLKEKFNINLNWLLSGEGEVFATEATSSTLSPELVEFFEQFPPEVQKKFIEFFKDSLEFLSKYSQTSSSRNFSNAKS